MANSLIETVDELTAVLAQIKTKIQTVPDRLQGDQTEAEVLAAVDTDRLFFELVQRRAGLLMEDLTKAKARKKPKSAGARAVDILGQASVDIRDIKASEMLEESLQNESDGYAARADALIETLKGFVDDLPAD